MKKTYRNAVRSKKMIRQAYWELLLENPARAVTVTDLVARADLTRNTFYAHYRDVSAVRDEFTAQLTAELHTALHSAGTAEAILHAAADFAQKNRDSLLLLQSDVLADGLKRVLRQAFDTLPDPHQFPEAIAGAAASGMIDLTMLWVRTQEELSPPLIADQLSRLLQPPPG